MDCVPNLFKEQESLMESEDHIKSMYGEICFESVHSSPLGIFYVYPFIFSALLTNVLRWLCELKIYPRYPCDIIVTKPYYTCYIITFADQTLLNLSLHYICALYCYCNELISYLEGQLLLTISHCTLSRLKLFPGKSFWLSNHCMFVLVMKSR